jgi:hypothetical protein
MTGAISTDSRFSSQVEIGSSGNDFDGAILIKVRISPSVASSNEAKDGTILSVTTGYGAVAVAELIFCTLLPNKISKVVCGQLSCRTLMWRLE